MKLFRYLSTEVFTLLTAITLILLVIFVSQEWFRWLSKVVAGRLAMGVMAELVLLSLPQLLGLLLPIAFFFAMLITYGRLYAENEMTAMFAGGLSRARLGGYSLAMAFIVAFVAGTLSLVVGPRMMVLRQQLIRTGGLSLMVDLIMPGRFQGFGRHGPVVYVKSATGDTLKTLFIAKHVAVDEWDIVRADSAKIVEPPSGSRQLILYRGHRYQGIVGKGQFKITAFDRFSLPITKTLQPIPMNVKALSSTYLWQHYQDSLANSAELQWRLSIPLMAFILALIAVPLAKVTPRQGRYAKIIPATLIIIVYANFLFFIRSWVKHGDFPVFIGLWGLHAGFGLLAAWLWYRAHPAFALQFRR